MTRHPALAGDLRPLLEVATLALKAGPLAAPADVKARAGARLLAAASHNALAT